MNLVSELTSPILLPGSDRCAYRDPAVYVQDGRFYLFCTYVDNGPGGPWLAIVESVSEDLLHWSTPRELTPRDKGLNYSSPGNVIRFGDRYVLCHQTYCRENGEKYGNARSRVYTMTSEDLLHWSEPELLRVKGEIPESEMGRMIDPYLLEDRIERGKWWCFYKQNGVSMSYSYDLRRWTYAGHTACGENVCVLPEREGYRIFHSPKNGIASLYTEDFVHFSTVGEPITLGQAQWDWAAGRLTAGFVLDCREDARIGQYLLFFHGSGPEDEETMFDDHASIGLAYSRDLLHWHWPGEEKTKKKKT